jgi:antitoxin VapB
MPISIKRDETVRLARALKQQTGLPMARIIHEALEDRLRRLEEGGPNPARRLADMRAISRRVAALPERDPRSIDDIVGYDDSGLPN